MTNALTEHDLDTLIGDQAIRLLFLANGKRLWEALPNPLHQMLINDVRATIRSAAGNADATTPLLPLARCSLVYDCWNVLQKLGTTPAVAKRSNNHGHAG